MYLRIFCSRKNNSTLLAKHDILTVEEACEALRMGYNAMYDLLNSGKLKGFRNGRVWRIPKLAIKEYILESARIKVKEERVR